MDNTPRTQSERRATTRRTLLDATIEMLMSEGLGACSLAAVARRADLTTGAVQHHFRNKADLMRAVISERLFAEDESFSWSKFEAVPIEERCKRVIRYQWSYYKNPKYIAIWDIILGARKDEDIQKEIKDWQQSGIKRFEAAIVRVFEAENLSATDVQAIQYFLNAHLRGLALLRLVQDEPEIIEQQLQMLGRMLADFIQQRVNA